MFPSHFPTEHGILWTLGPSFPLITCYVELMMSKYVWVWGHSLGHGKSTSGHSNRKSLLPPRSYQLPSVNISSVENDTWRVPSHLWWNFDLQDLRAGKHSWKEFLSEWPISTDAFHSRAPPSHLALTLFLTFLQCSLRNVGLGVVEEKDVIRAEHSVSYSLNLQW